jgi:hypothetical protein
MAKAMQVGTPHSWQFVLGSFLKISIPDNGIAFLLLQAAPSGPPWQAVEKRPSAALRSSFVTAAYAKVRLIPHNFARLASGHF